MISDCLKVIENPKCAQRYSIVFISHAWSVWDETDTSWHHVNLFEQHDQNVFMIL